MGDKTHLNGSIALRADGEDTIEDFDLEARVKIFGAGPIVERFIEHQAREVQQKSVAFMRRELGLLDTVSTAEGTGRSWCEVTAQ